MIRTGLIWSGLLLSVMFGASLYAWMTLPEGVQVPVHWDANGEVDGYGGKVEAFLVMPIIASVLVAIMAFLPKIDPRRVNLEKSRFAYLAGWLGSMAVMTGAHLVTIYTALGGEAPVSNLVFVMIGILFAVLGNYIAKTRSNWFVGLRTPWTLSSEHAWMIGNRYLGRGMLITGILIVFAAFLSKPTIVIILTTVGVMGTAIIATVASYFAWKNDPEAKNES